jgi:hypothetical protein
MKKIAWVVAMVVLVGIVAGSVASAQTAPPPRWDLKRLSGGVTANVLTYKVGEVPNQGGFAPDLWVSYNLAELASVASSVSWDWANDLAEYRAGVRLKLQGALGQSTAVFAGVDYVWYDGSYGITLKDTFTGRVQGSWAAIHDKNGRTLAFAVASVEYDPDNHLTTYRGGVRAQIFGGSK